MHYLLYALSAPFLLVGIIELIPAIFEWLAYIVMNGLALLFGSPTQSMAQLVKSAPGGGAVLLILHGMPAAFASPLAFVAGGLLISLGTASKEAAENKRQRERAEQANALQRETDRSRAEAAAQEAIVRRREQAEQLREQVARLSAAIPAHVKRAVAAIDLAEREFRDGLLDPFWDATEAAVTELARVDAAVRAISANLDQYRLLASMDTPASSTATTIAGGLLGVGVASAAQERLQRVIRGAQRSIDFTTIFHMRRTNRILVSGFTTLGQAINDMGTRLEDAVGSVGRSIGELHDANQALGASLLAELNEIRSASRRSSAETQNELRDIRRTDARVADVHHAQGKVIIDLLDNIQRGRRTEGLDWKAGTQKNI